MSSPGIPQIVVDICMRLLGEIPPGQAYCLCRQIDCPKHKGKWRCGRIFHLGRPRGTLNRCCAGAPFAEGWGEVETQHAAS